MTPAAATLTHAILKSRADYCELLTNHKFAELEAIANNARATQAKWPNGAWKITQFYVAFRLEASVPEETWLLREKLHLEWIAQFPKSVTAHLAYCEFLTNYAWKARGSETGDQVTQDGWKYFEKRLTKARAILEDSKSLGSCPYWWIMRILVAMGLNESGKECEKIFLEGKALYPECYRIDFQYYHYLLPRWHGNRGDWEAVAEKEIQRPGGLGSMGYALTVGMMAQEFYTNIFKESNVSWVKVNEGFEKLRATYPDSKDLLNEYCHLAMLAHDVPKAQKLLDEIGDDVVPSVWGGINYFNVAKEWIKKEK